MPETIEQAEAGYRNVGFPRHYPQRPDINDCFIVGLTELAKLPSAGTWEAAPVKGDEK